MKEKVAVSESKSFDRHGKVIDASAALYSAIDRIILNRASDFFEDFGDVVLDVRTLICVIK